WSAHRALPDDSYITLSYARNLAEHGEWALVHGWPANSATSPLNVWLLAAGTVGSGSPVIAAGLVLAASLAAVGMWTAQLARVAGLSRWASYVAVGLLGTSPLLASTVGLETYLGVALLVGLVRYGAEGSWLASGVLAGLLVLCRPDYAVMCAAVAVTLPGLRRRLLPAAGVAVAVAAPWFVASWFLFGSALPDTFAFKTSEHDWWGWTLATGWSYYAGLVPPHLLILAALPALAGVVLVAATVHVASPAQRVALAFAAAGVFHFVALSVLGVPPYLWYYAPLFGGLALAAVVSLAAVSPCAVLTLSAVSGAATAAVLALGVPWVEAPMLGNFAHAQDYAAVGRDLPGIVPPGEPVASPGEVGTIAFHCRCPLVDKFTSRPVAVVQIRKAADGAGPVMQWLLAANYAHLPPQPDPVVPTWRLEYREDPLKRHVGDVRWWPATTSWHKPAQIVLRLGR
ncbi:MAG TPA: hypothetical protein VGJ13_12165, partial [Pseudonocardiaceae bacterium]